jgi:hypothetical protein
MKKPKRALILTVSGTIGLLLGCFGAPTPSFAHFLEFELTPSSQALATCIPDATMEVSVEPTTDRRGFDTFDIRGRNLPPNTTFTVFLIEQAGAPFGAAEYIGDLTTNSRGNGHNKFRLIVGEAFASTIVNGIRTRVDLNRIGVWFADPADDEFCIPGSKPTPFDGDGEAGVQVFNSANADPLPAP